jgi:hypothetical protein
MKRFTGWFAATLLVLSAGHAQAGASDDACKALMEARSNLVAMLDTSDKAMLDDHKAKVQAASAKLEEIVAGMAKGPDAAKANEFTAVWGDFKKTRDGEIIPQIYAGKKAEAKALASGIQAERMKKLKGTMGCQ